MSPWSFEQNGIFFLCVSLGGLVFPRWQLGSWCWILPPWKGAVYCICITIILISLFFSNHRRTSVNHLMSSLLERSFTRALCVSHCSLPVIVGTQPHPENRRRSRDANVTFNSAHYWQVTFYWWMSHMENNLTRIRTWTYRHNLKNYYTSIS